MRSSSVLLLLAAVCLVAAACGGARGNKAGAQVHRSVSLVYEVPDDGDPPAAVFAQAAARHSHGTVHVNHDDTSPYSSADPGNELLLARALESGRVPIAYMPARAWAVAGVPEFRALLAPFVLTTEKASRIFAASPIAADVLQSLPHSVVGLALVPQEARRILAVRPPTSVAALHGLRIRIVDNPQTAADLRAVGAVPVEGLSAAGAARLLAHHRLDGVESNPASILGNGYQTVAHNFSTWSPFAKFQLIAMNRRAWDRLSAAQRAALRTAARVTVAYADRTTQGTERKELTDLCEAAGRPARPTRLQLDRIATAMRNVVPHFVTDARAKELLVRLARLPGTGVQIFATPLPPKCRHPSGFFTAQTGGPTIPPGTYRVTISAKDWLKGGVINREARTSITFVTNLNGDGTWDQTQQPTYPDQCPCSGRYFVHGDEVTFVMLSAGANGNASTVAPETVRWSYFDGKLTFRNVVVADSGSRVLYAAHSWRKIR